jgi:hypothetical protein
LSVQTTSTAKELGTSKAPSDPPLLAHRSLAHLTTKKGLTRPGQMPRPFTGPESNNMPQLWSQARVLASTPIHATLATSLHASKALRDGHAM